MATGRLLLQMTLMGLPARPRLGAGLFEMDALVHVIDPRKRDEMVLTAGVGIILGQLDLIPTFQTVHSADVLARGRVFQVTVSSDQFVVVVDPNAAT